MSDEILRRHQLVWQKKPVLRLLYREWYQEITGWLQPGRTLEVGGGTGNLKEFTPSVVCTDIVKLPWVDAVVDAQQLPFATSSLANIVVFDALHHLENVRYFFDEALRPAAWRSRHHHGPLHLGLLLAPLPFLAS